ncbi:MAG: ABC transporter ATP-binding protein [Actinomycetota bacterium]
MSRDVIARLLRLLKGHRGLMAVSALCRVVNQTLAVAIPAVAVVFVVEVVDGSGRDVGSVVWVLVALALVKGLFRYLEQFTGHAVAFRLLAVLRNQVYWWLERIEPARLEDERSGDLVARVSGDISRVEPFYAHTIAPLVAAVLVPVVSLSALAWLFDPLPALVLAGVVVLYLGFVPWIGRRRVEALGSEVRRMAGQSAAAVADIVQGAHEIAVLDAGSEVLAKTVGSGHDLMGVRSLLAGSSARRVLAGGVVSAIAVVAVAGVGVAADLTLQTLSVSLAVAWTVMAPLRSLEEIVSDTERALAAAGRLFELEDLEPQRTGHADVADDPAHVRFEEVTVEVAARMLLDGVDLEVAPGSFLGVVGPSGSGKSTLVQTLVRHRDPASGRVMLGSREVGELSSSELSRTVAFVPQRPDIFHGTVRSNLTIAGGEAGEDDLRSALARAHLLEWVDSLDRGLDTLIGERGVGMSGGQLQRLALARAFLRDPAVLVLDEATSELDSGTETAVLEEVYAERGSRTLIVVAHRMETITTADQIVVIDRGRLVESGTHETLRSRGGLYSALWQRHEDMLAVG